MKSRKMSKTKLGLALITFLSSGVTLAAGETSSGMDLSSLTNSVDFSPVTIAILAIAGSLITLYACYAGARFVLRMVKGA